MTLKKKLLIALLSTTCVAAGAAGLAACDNKPKADPPYTVTAVDQNGNPVQGVVFRIGYYKNYSTSYVYDDNGKTLTATTDKNGKATFKGFTPEEDIQYSVYLNEQDERAYPYGYKNENISVDFDENWKATYEFKYVPSSYNDNLTNILAYKRTFDDSGETINYVEEGSHTLTLNLKKDVHTYFEFLPYKELGAKGVPDNASESEISEKVAYNQVWATKAAAGLYTVTYTTTSNTAATLYYFENTFSFDEDGIPEYKDKQVSGKTGSITLELTVDGYKSRSPQNFGVYATNDCTVTVSVERVGDAEEPPEIPVTPVEAPQNLTQYGAQSGVLTLMTVDGSLDVVLGDNGVYHVGSKTGPELLVNLTEVLKRVGECSIMDLANKDVNPYFNTGHVFSKYVDGTLTAIYDYSDFLNAYAEKVNSDGVYPVNADVYEFLQLLAAKGQMLETALAGKYAWLLPCQYYMPADGMEALGTGTQEDPFILLGTANRFNLSGTSGGAYAQFTATTSGVYTFSASGCTISIDGNKTGFYNENVLLHVCLAENEKVTFSVEGEGNATITVGNATANSVEAVYGDDADSKGMDPDSAILLTFTGYTAYVVDSSVNDGVWVYVNPIDTMTYSFEVQGSPFAQFIYNNKPYNYGDTLELTCVGGTKYAFFLTAKNGADTVNGVYALDWQIAEKEATDGGEMQLGTTQVTVSEEDLILGVKYTFTSEEGGTFVITTDSEDANIFDGGFQDYVIGTEPYKFTLEPGETFTFYCTGTTETAISYNVTIAPHQVTGDPSFDDNGGTKTITLDMSNKEDGVEFIFLSTTGGTYTISVSNDAQAMIKIDSAKGSDRDNGTVVNTAASTYSYEFTLDAGGYITFIGYVPGYTTGSYDVTITKN